MTKEGIYKMFNGELERVNHNQLIVKESWRRTRDRLRLQFPAAKIKYSYKTQRFEISFPLPLDLDSAKIINFNY